MSLDRWFGKNITNTAPITPPNSDGHISKKHCVRKITRVAPHAPNPRLQLFRAKRGHRPDLTEVAIKQISRYTETVPGAVGSRPYSLSGLDTHDVLFTGLKGEIVLFDSHKEGYGSIKFDHNAPIRDLALFKGNSSDLIACSDHDISICDIEKSTELSTFHNDGLFGLQSIAATSKLVVTGSKTGSAFVLDVRANNTVQTIWDAHDPHRRLRQSQKPRGPSLTSVEWHGDQNVVTGSIHDQTVKFWDLRKVTTPVNSVTMQNRAPIGGICSLKQDGESKIWALGKNGSLESMLPQNEFPIDVYTGNINVNNYTTNMCIIADPSFASDLIACGGKEGLTVANRPTLESAYNFTNSMSGTKLPSEGYFTKTFWHKYSRSLVAVNYETGLYHFWSN